MLEVKNLIRAELIKIKGVGVLLWVYLAIFVAASFIPSLAWIGAIIFLYFWVYSPAAYDEINKGEQLMASLPVTRSQLVQAKYLYSLIGFVAVNAVCLLVRCLDIRIVNMSVDNFAPWISLMLSAIFIAIVQPLILYFGVTKARYWVMGCYVGGICLSTFLQMQANSAGMDSIQLGFLASLLVSVVLIGVSYMISIRIYSHREFI